MSAADSQLSMSEKSPGLSDGTPKLAVTRRPFSPMERSPVMLGLGHVAPRR
jgi:hypothetical protein